MLILSSYLERREGDKGDHLINLFYNRHDKLITNK